MGMQVGEKAGVARAPHKQHHPPSLMAFPLGPELWEDKTTVGRSMAKVPFLLCAQQLLAGFMHTAGSFCKHPLLLLLLSCWP